MELGLIDEVYKDILINVNEFDLIRYFREDHHPSVDPTSREDKDTVHNWPNQYAIDRFHRSHKEYFVEELEAHNVEIFDSEFMFSYLLDSEEYQEDKPSDEKLADHLRFKHIRNYFTIERFLLWARNNTRVDITLQYRETFPNKFSDMLRISNTTLLDYLMRHPKRDELTWKIEMRDNPRQYFTIDYTMTTLVFKELELYFDSPFHLERKEEINSEAKKKGYALESDRERYERIVDKSYENFKFLVDDPTLYQKVKDHYEKYVTDS